VGGGGDFFNSGSSFLDIAGVDFALAADFIGQAAELFQGILIPHNSPDQLLAGKGKFFCHAEYIDVIVMFDWGSGWRCRMYDWLGRTIPWQEKPAAKDSHDDGKKDDGNQSGQKAACALKHEYPGNAA
jgi:hypothetical protein